MANFDRSGMTQAGINLMGKAIGGATIQFTKLVLGDGEMTGEILNLQGVVSPKQNVDVTRIERNDNQCTVGGALLTSSVKQGFFWRECGLYAMDPDVGEILYNYAYSTKPDYIAASDSGMMEEILVSMIATVGSNTNVDVTIDTSMVMTTKKEFIPLKTKVDEISVTVTEFGAIGDGIADDTLSIQSAIDSLGVKGGVVIFPYTPNGYRINTHGINVINGITLRGIGYPRILTSSNENYNSIIHCDLGELKDVCIENLFFDQFEDTISPSNSGLNCCCIRFLGKIENVTIRHNKFNAVGGWCIGISDYGEHIGSNHIKITNNILNYRIVDTTEHYDCSAIYIDSINHEISYNTIESEFNGDKRLVGGIETHGTGTVTYNKIKNIQTGIHVISSLSMLDETIRDVGFNTLINCITGVNAYCGTGKSIVNLRIHDNIGTIQESILRTDFWGPCSAVRLKCASGILNCSDIEIFNNNFKYINDNPVTTSGILTIVEGNGAYAVYANDIIKNVKIYNNKIENYPFTAFACNASSTGTLYNIEIFNNTCIDCCYASKSEPEKSFLYATKVDTLNVHGNKIVHVNKNGMEHVIVFSGFKLNFKDNVHVSQNGFLCYDTYFTKFDYNSSTTNYADLQHLKTLFNKYPSIFTDNTIDSSQKSYFNSDYHLYNGWDKIVSYNGKVVTEYGCGKSISATVERINDYKVKVVNGTLAINDIIKFNGIEDKCYIVVGVGFGENKDIVKLAKTDNTWPPYIPSFEGTTTVTNKPPKFKKIGEVSYRTCVNSPIGSETPTFLGEEIFDTTNMAWYKSTGLTSSHWKIIN